MEHTNEREIRTISHDTVVVIGYVLCDRYHRRVSGTRGDYGYVTRAEALADLASRPDAADLHVVELQTPKYMPAGRRRR
jgi:hypothetical protein